MVRTRIDLGYIENVQRRRVCFSKRRNGLIKKAHELSVLCNAEIGVIVFSDTGRLYEFASSSMQQVLRRRTTATTGPAPSPTQAPPDMSNLLAQQAEKVRMLKQRVEMLETEKQLLLNDLHLTSNNQPMCYDNANLETALTLRLPSSNADPRIPRI